MKNIFLISFNWFILLCSPIIAVKENKRILILPSDNNSGILQMVHLANYLSEDGHQVIFVTGSKNYQPVKQLHSNITIHEDRHQYMAGEKLSSVLNYTLQTKTSSFEVFRNFVKAFETLNKLPESYLSDAETLEDMKRCDLAIIAAPGPFWMGVIIPYKLNIPYITINPRTDPWSYGVVISPVAEPNFGLSFLDKNSGFYERLFNAFTTIVGNKIILWIVDFKFGHLVSKLVPERPFRWPSELYRESGMVLVQQNPFCLDFPRNTMPHYQMIGGFSAQKTLSASNETMKPFLDFISQSDFVMMTLGSQVKTIPDDKLELFLKVFPKLSQFKFIVRHTGQVGKVPENVMINSWLPQSDLMAHPNLKLFITHGGLNGQNEAAYNGVPMLITAIYGDHWYNARRAKRLGTAEVLDFSHLSEPSFSHTLNLMLSNKTYSQNAFKCKKILQSVPSAKEISLFWINHVLEFGYDHLQPLTKKMPWWKILMLDIVLVGCLCLLVIFLLSVSSLKLILRRLMKV
ncbi:UDP-glucuronosyltransferase 1A6-like [Convolutriloba macropyga]|uniref:UDP-glucuronosyltransferase 1A6-like n=1 Tax=Convolutriloba macropyga TaxID=536237 RepID=UPI003F51FF90